MGTILWILILLLCFGVSTVILFGLRLFATKSNLLRILFYGTLLAFIIPFAVFTFMLHLPLNGIIIMLHICVFWIYTIVADGIIERKIRANSGKENSVKAGTATENTDGNTPLFQPEPTAVESGYNRNYRHIRRFAAVVFGCFLYLTIGFLCAHQVRATWKKVETDKVLPGGSIRVAQISDVHLGTTMDGEKFARILKRIGGNDIDLLVITGDLVDGNTSRNEMINGCNALGDIHTKSGVYYIAGNHDSPESGEFTEEELFSMLKQNGVTVLRDETVLINDSFYLIGRKDRSESRKSIAELTESLDDSKYQIVLDHQPSDFEREAAAGVDLVLCGHTHGGYLIPVKWFAPLFMENLFGDTDRFSGTETRGNTTFYVSDGVGTWGCSFKTGAMSEYVIFEIMHR